MRYAESKERYSLCVVHKMCSGNLTYYRIADYNPNDNPPELIPVSTKKIANPKTLYNPNAISRYDDRDSDFIFFGYHPKPNDPRSWWTTSVYDGDSGDPRVVSLLDDIPEPMEVILCKGATCEGDLRDLLASGIEFEGRTTQRFYIVYAASQDRRLAVVCDRSNFLCHDGRLFLKSDIANPRATRLTAPRTILSASRIIKSPFYEAGHRMVYADLEPSAESGRVLLRPLSYYAADYVKWFIGNQSLDVSKSMRRLIAPIIETALSRPDSIKSYLNSEEYDSAVESLRAEITAYASKSDNELLDDISESLLRYEPLHERCLREVEKRYEDVLVGLRDEIDSAQAALNSLNDDADSKKAELLELDSLKKSLGGDIATANASLKQINESKELVLSELEENIALKLGLRAVAGNNGPTEQPHECIHSINGETVPAQHVLGAPIDVISKNLQRLGLSSLASDTDTPRECKRLAACILAALRATQFLVAPAGIAYVIADALSIASSGMTARRVYVPSEYPNVDTVVRECAGSEPVTIIENLLDPVNEGVLIPLLSRDIGGAAILPYTSLDSLDLVAKEAWGQMFMLRSYPLVRISGEANRKKTITLSQAIEEILPKPPSKSDILDEILAIEDELSGAGVHRSSLPLVSSVVLSAEALERDDDVEPYVTQHLLLASVAARNHPEAREPILTWADGDAGFTMFFDEYARQK